MRKSTSGVSGMGSPGPKAPKDSPSKGARPKREGASGTPKAVKAPVVRVSAAVDDGRHSKWYREEAHEKWQVTQEVAEMGAQAGFDEVEALSRTLQWRGADPYVRLGAANALGKLGEAAGFSGARTLTQSLRLDRDLNVRRRAAQALGQIGPLAGADAASALAHAIVSEQDIQLRWRACEAVGKLGRAGGEHGTPALIRAMKDPDVGVRTRAAEAMASLGEVVDHEGTAALIAALKDTSTSVREQAKASLTSLRDSSARTLVSAAHDYVRGRAAWILGEMGEGAGRPALESLVVSVLHEPESYIRRRVVEALGRMGTEGGCLAYVALQRAQAEDPDDYVQVKAGLLLPTVVLSPDAHSEEALQESRETLERLLDEDKGFSSAESSCESDGEAV